MAICEKCFENCLFLYNIHTKIDDEYKRANVCYVCKIIEERGLE
ncbi:MAG: hypothetical protein Q4P17_07635 [Methanobacterium sp.]|nr:hypothetical protein [Methanobacterium sp.]